MFGDRMRKKKQEKERKEERKEKKKKVTYENNKYLIKNTFINDHHRND